jgi:hypothetical protein
MIMIFSKQTPIRFLTAAAACSLAVGGVATAALATPAERLADFQPHTAVYDVELADRSDRASNIRAANGRLVYELEGDACEGFVTNFRFVLNFSAGDNQVLTDQQTTTFEAPDGKSFRFATRIYTNEKLDRQTIGNASIDGNGLNIQLRKPEAESVELDDAIFPTQHLASILDAARDGETFVRAQVFDGADNGTETFYTNTVIGRGKSTIESENVEAVALDEDTASRRWWPVTVSYFKETGLGEGESAPFYTVSFKLYENGVSRDLRMDYEDFSLEAKLKSLDSQPLIEAVSCE